jgi:DNA-binding YbaB/EbfC family protein
MKARLPQGMGGGPQNMNAMMRQVQKFQEERETLAAELEEREYEVSAGGGAVSIKLDGTHRVTEIKIAPEIIDPDDPETLEDIITAAVNEGLSRVEADAAKEMSALAAKYGIPEGAF